MENTAGSSETHHKKGLSRSVRRSTSMPAISSGSRPIIQRQNKDSGSSCVSIDNIYSIWNRMKKNSSSSHLSLSELQTICEAVGLEKNSSRLAAKKVFEALSIEMSGHISFEQFMTIVTEHSEVLQGCEQVVKPASVGEAPAIIENFNELPFEIIDREVLLQVWSEANIPQVDNMLKRIIGVGFDFKCFKYCDIETAIEEEIDKEVLHETVSSLFKAGVSVNRHIINAMKTHINQITVENQKLYDEKKEACIKNSLLIQDYDEQFENMAKNKVQLVERTHSEALKKVYERFNSERESLTSMNQTLETKLNASELRETMLMQEIITLKKENKNFEMENIEYHKQIEDLLDKNIDLNNKLATSGVSMDEKFSSCNEEIIELLDKIEVLQIENSKLRDENDEYLCDIERLNVDLLKFKKTTKIPESLKTYKKLDLVSTMSIVSTNSEIPPSNPYFSNEEESKNVTESSEITNMQKDNEKSRNRVIELEKSLDLLQQEYEDCENYWQSKLNDERINFETKIEASSKKITELLQRLTDIEEERTLARRGALSPIDETFLELQYTELEKELADLQSRYVNEIEAKDEEIQLLKKQINTAGIKCDEDNHSEKSISSRNSKLNSNSIKECNSSSNEEIHEIKKTVNHMKQEIYELINYKKNIIKEIHELQQKSPSSQDTIHPNLSKKFEKLKMRNKYLQSVVRKQQSFAETSLNHYWHQQNQESIRLRNLLDIKDQTIYDQLAKLSSADDLCKELYVENSKLFVTIQELEHKISRLSMNPLNSSIDHYTSVQ